MTVEDRAPALPLTSLLDDSKVSWDVLHAHHGPLEPDGGGLSCFTLVTD